MLSACRSAQQAFHRSAPGRPSEGVLADRAQVVSSPAERRGAAPDPLPPAAGTAIVTSFDHRCRITVSGASPRQSSSRPPSALVAVARKVSRAPAPGQSYRDPERRRPEHRPASDFFAPGGALPMVSCGRRSSRWAPAPSGSRGHAEGHAGCQAPRSRPRSLSLAGALERSPAASELAAALRLRGAEQHRRPRRGLAVGVPRRKVEHLSPTKTCSRSGAPARCRWPSPAAPLPAASAGRGHAEATIGRQVRHAARARSEYGGAAVLPMTFFRSTNIAVLASVPG